MGKWIKHSGWHQNFRQPQLFKKGKMSYTLDSVHEGFISHSDKEIGVIKNFIWQFPFKNTEEVINKANRYSTLGIEKLQKSGVTGGVLKAFFHGLWSFIKHYIFPGSFIPCISVMTKTAADNKLQLTRLDDIGLSYAQTLHDWRKQFFDVLPQVKALGFNDEFIRMWDFYLCYCEGGFKEKVISNVHLLFQNNDLEGRTSCG